MKIVEIRQESELTEMRDAWNALLNESASRTIFLTWEWLTAWWTAYGNPGDLRILAALDESGRLLGIAPLWLQTVRRYGVKVQALAFIGDGSNDSDYLDFIIARGRESQVIEAFSRHWRRDVNRGLALLLREIPESSPNLPLLKAHSDEMRLVRTESEIPCATVRLPRDWETYLAMLRPRFRTKVRSVLRNTENRPEARFGFCTDISQSEPLLAALFDLHARRWAREGKPGVFGGGQKRSFYRTVSPLLLDRGWLRFSWLEWNGQILACQYGFEHGGVYFQLQEGYNPAAEHFNPGVALRAWTIREYLKQGVHEYDFMAGIGRHKSDWASETKTSRHVTIASRTPRNLVFCHGQEWEEQARKFAANHVPQRILAARKALLRRPAADAPARRGGMRQWAARVYFHSGLPELTRPLRSRYQVSATRHSPWKISITRRTQASARILYYHRVNDDNDPFFPAISTKLFDEHMRHVCRNYKVVSLTEMVRRLEEDASEPMVAITFDDGYRDNFLNAFPILRSYRLPAAVFLATGSVDSREPLWFEQLALALKSTEREFIDLEWDIPRRYYLKTEAERLRANDQIFELLRKVPDIERRQRLTEALAAIGGAIAADRRGKMLTWDEIRQMKKSGIDFGGHTVTHPFVSKLSPDQVVWEVSECKRRIEAELQTPVSCFAYPNGRQEDFGMWNKDVVRNAGYRAAVTTMWGLNYRSTDPMELRRGGPWEPTAALFASKLDWYQWVNG